MLILSRKSLKDFFIYGFGQLFNIIAPFIILRYIIKVCGISNFGISSVALAIMYFLVVFIDYGTDIIGVKNIAINRSLEPKLKKIFCNTFLAKGIMLLIVCAVSSLIFIIVPVFKSDFKVYLLSLTILFGQFLNPIWYFQGIEEYKQISYLNILSKTLYIVSIFCFVKQQQDFIYINFFLGLGSMIAFSIGLTKIIRDLKIKTSDFSLIESIYLLKQDSGFCISQMFIAIKNYFPILFVSLFSGFNMAAYYKIIEQIVLPIRTYFQVFFRFFYPKLSYKYSKNALEGLQFWKRFSLANVCLTFFLLLALFLFSKEVLIFFNIDSSQLSDFDTLLRWFLLYPIILLINFSLETIYLVAGENKIYIRNIILNTVLSLLLLSLLVESLNIYGVLIALITSEMIMTGIYCYQLKKVFREF